MEKKKYYLGLDLGTSSIGWAVTDDSYRLIKKQGKELWGVREFEEAKTSEERRSHRISRRRTQRNHVRIGLVKSYFENEINKVDPYFYQRLDNSKYYLEDKDETIRSKYGLFADADYTDWDYYKNYPTIFHLRKELIENANVRYDIRLIFLAVLNLFKRRGHFLNASLGLNNENETLTITDAYQNLVFVLQDKFGEEDANDEWMLSELTENVQSGITEIFSNREYSRTKKVELIAEKLGVSKKDKKKYELIKAICGLNVDYKKLFTLEDVEEKVEAKFSDIAYGEKEPDLLEKLGDDLSEVVLALKSVYDAATLGGILRGEKYLSQARVADYEKHKKDLKILKRAIHKHCPDKYDVLFREMEEGSYSAYVHFAHNNERKRRNVKTCSNTDLYATIKKLLQNADDEDVRYIKNSIEAEDFLPKQLTGANGVIPNQVHARELIAILNNASKFYDFLNDIDESGLTVKERIIRLYTFTIPYYIGPTSEDSKIGWVIRKEKGQVLPWNIEQKIDIHATSKEFIERMVRRCTYMNEEKVLPKASLLYEAYMVLNEINNIKIDNVRIDNNLKQELFNEIFKKGKKPLRKELKEWLINHGVSENAVISGIDIQINNSLSSYGKFKNIFGEKIELDTYKHVIEDLIFQCTVHGGSKNIIVEYIKEKYPEEVYPELNERNIKRILGFKFKDWGRFSKELLTLQGCQKSTGEIVSIIRALWDTNYSFMELITSKEYSFAEEIASKENIMLRSLSDFSVEVLDEYYFSAPVKRMINQAMLIIKEVHKIMGGEPERIFIEMTRKDEEKGDRGRKDSRQKNLQALFNSIVDETHHKNYWKDLIDKESSTGRLKSKKMYLYIRQMGRDMYTGEEIDLDELFNDNKYDIDHIYPRHFVKDDNIENNLVLSSKKMNEEVKKDLYPIPDTIRHNKNVIELWERLHKEKLINDTKYNRLRDCKPFGDEQRAGFIARQLVETSQGTKGIADILKQAMPNVTIVYSKADIVSRFRADYELYKSRLVNEYHHAQDAYLNIVVGNVYYTKFTSNPLNFIKNEYNSDPVKNNYNLNKMFDRRVERDGYIAWLPASAREQSTLQLVKSVMAKNTPMYTRQSFEKHGAISEATLYGKDVAKENVYMSIKMKDDKMCDVKKYGGYKSISCAYFCLVEHEMKGERIRTLEGVPVYLTELIEKNPSELDNYCSKVLGLNSHVILIKKIKIQSLFEINGYRGHLSKKSSEKVYMRNAVNLVLKREWVNYIYMIEKFLDGTMYYENEISKDRNILLYEELIKKHTETIYSKRKPYGIGNILIEGKGKFKNLSVYDQCKVILDILKLSAIGSTRIGLSEIGRKQQIAEIYISKKLSKDNTVLLINQSVTGFYENVVDLNKI